MLLLDKKTIKMQMKDRILIKMFVILTNNSYLCSVQWNEGLDKAPHFILNKPPNMYDR